jgi:tRNA G46 methylase TrmB
MFANSKAVSSNQEGIHENLQPTVEKYLRHEFKRPFAQHTVEAFAQAQAFIDRQPNKGLIIDACCGTAHSTAHIAKMHPEHVVLGIDQSLHRLHKADDIPENALCLQADLLDFYRLAARQQWQLDKHFLLYPNPWPKAAHLKRRWHAMPCFPAMLALGGVLEVRSNWQNYIEEFALALKIAGRSSEMQEFKPAIAITAFEKKYLASGHQFWRLQSDLNG